MRTLSFKIDVCTWEGLHRGVVPLLGVLARHDVRATFCLAFGPDNSGKALLNVFKPGFLKKMVRTGAPTTYGLRTMVSGTLLPARPIAAGAPEIVRRIVDGGHEVAVHGWDHRRWQDRLPRLPGEAVLDDLRRARDACENIVGAPPRGTAAPGWIVTAASLAAQDSLGFAWASDLRGGVPCRLTADGRELATVQIPTTGLCIEELVTTGIRGDTELVRELTAGVASADTAVLAVHAEIEGRAHLALFDGLVPGLCGERDAVLPLGEVADRLAATDLPVRRLATKTLPGRSGGVATCEETA